MIDPMFSPAFTDTTHAPVTRPACFLKHDVYVAEVGRKAIFLDLNADKYQAVDRASYQSLDDAVPTERQQKLLKSLTDRHLLTNDPLAGKPVAQIAHETACRHLLPDSKAVRALQRATLLLDLFRTAVRSDRLLRKAPLQACVKQIRAAKAACTHNAPLPSWLPYVLHARFYYPADLICLRDSFMMMNLLLSRGISADWVFGVQADPFQAHCWVQIGDLVINDSFERTNRFTPILVV
jgi:hypothetical protein